MVAYRLDLSALKPFVLKNKGSVMTDSRSLEGAPPGWNTYSWVANCTHDFLGRQQDGEGAVGVRLTGSGSGGRSGAMLFVSPVKVAPNRLHALKLEYQASESFAPSDVRVTSTGQNWEKHMKVLGKLGPTGGKWEAAAFRFASPDADGLRIEFHHYGPLGPGNELFIRAMELVETE